MTEKEKQLLDGVKQMEKEAPSVGLCAAPFQAIREELERVYAERDSYVAACFPNPAPKRRASEIPDVLMFIGRFSNDGLQERVQVIDTFLFGCCWWFAFILKSRFEREYPCEIVVNYVANHFACRINGSVYDITGRRADDGKWERWDDCTDDALKERIIEQCIMF